MTQIAFQVDAGLLLVDTLDKFFHKLTRTFGKLVPHTWLVLTARKKLATGRNSSDFK